MHPEANSCVPTLADFVPHVITKPPLWRLCHSCIGSSGRPASALLISLAVLSAGCSTSSPRFRSDDGGSGAVVQEENEFRFASKIREEESREDDRKVDMTSVRKRLTSEEGGTKYSNITPEGLSRDQFLLNVVSYLGVPYRYGGVGKDGIDCSGFTSSVYASSTSVSLPRSAREQFRAGAAVEKDQLQFGDLVFFNTTGQSPSHVGIYLEDDLFAHASVTSGVTISSLESTYYKKRFLGARRMVQ